MATVYPNQIDNSTSLPLLIDGVSPVNADSINRIRNAVIAIEAELGINPSSLYGTVANRFIFLENLINSGGGGGGGGGGNFVAGGDLSGSATFQTVIKLRGSSLPSPSFAGSANTVLHGDNSGSLNWSQIDLTADVSGILPIANQANQTLGGDLSGTTNSATVIKLHGTSVPASPSNNQVLVATSGTTSVWQQIVDSQVSSSAAIAGTKISPNFGSQNVSTTGTLSAGATTATSIQDTGLGTGVVHSDSSGNFTSSTIVNADVSGTAAIAGTKITPAFGSQNISTTGTLSSGAATFTSIKDSGLGTGVIHSDSSGNFTSSTIVDADVSGTAAITGTKINPAFGAQNISTTGTLAAGATTVTSIQDTGLNTGVVHSDSSGNFTSSTIVNTDVSASAAIAGTKISPAFGSQNISTTGTLTAGQSALGSSTSANNIAGSLVFTTKTFSTTGTIDTSTNDLIIYADTSGGSFNLTLPAPTNGRILIIKDKKQTFATNSLTVVRHGTEKIDGVSASLNLGTNNQELIFTSDGTDWYTTNFSTSTTGAAGGDLTGSYPSPTVAKINGTSVPATPSNNQVLVATSGTTATWEQISDAQVSSSAAIAVNKLAAGTSGQVLLNNSTPIPTWTTLSSDVTINSTGATTVNSISGSSPIAITPASLQWGTGTSSPNLKQANNTTASATGQTLTIQAQNATGTTATGGQLALTSGTGTSTAGNVVLQTGGTTRLTANASGVITIANLGTGVVHADSSGNLTSSTIVDADVNSSAAISGTKINPAFGAQNISTTGTLTAGQSALGSSTSANNIAGSLTLTTKTFSTTGTIDTSTNDLLIYADTSSAAFTLTLPAPTNGRTLIIKDKKQTFATNNLTLARHGTEKIDGTAASLILNINNQELILISDGTDWYTNNFSSIPTGSAGGDLSGTYPNPTVAKINGSSVPAGGSLTTGNVLQVSGSSTLTYGPVNLAGGSNYISGNLPVTNIAPGTSAQVLLSNSTPTATWTTLSNDVTISATGSTTVNSISGSSPVAITPAILQWITGTSSPTIKQADNTTNSATGQALTIQAQNATGTTTTGGQLALTSGTGTTAAGSVIIQTGGTTRLTANSSGVITIANLGTGVVHADSSGNLTSSTIVNADVSATAAIAGTKISPAFGSQNISTTGTLSAGQSSLGSSTSANSISGSLTLTTKTFSTTGIIDTSTNDLLIYADTSSAAFTLTLPAPTNGRTLIIKDKKQTFATNNLTLARHGTEKIDGTAASLVLSINNQEIIFTSDGTDWYTNNFSETPTGPAGGDLSGFFPNPTVAKINGSSVPAGGSLTTGNVLQVNGSSSLTYGPVNLGGGSNFVSGNLPVTNIAPGTSAQVLISNSTPTATWTTLSNDVTISATGSTTVNSISGSSPIAITPAALQWTTGTSAPTLKQADNTTNSATAQALTIQAQNATGTTATGGQLALTSGTGTTAAGSVVLQTGGTTRLTANATGVITIANLGTGVVHADSSGNLTSSTIVNADISSSAAIAGTKITPAFGSQNISTTGTLSAGATTATSIQDTGLGTGVVHSDSSGNFTSSNIVNADVSATAAIAGTKINPAFGSQNISTTGTLSAGQSALGSTTSANSISGSLALTTKTFSSTGTIDTSTNDLLIYADTSTAAFNLTLPAPTNGRFLIIKDKKQSFATHNLTIVRNGTEKIDGVSASLVLSTNNQELTFTSDGTDWYTTNFSSPTTGTAGGDLSGSYPNPTVAKINGASVPAAGALTTGNVLQVNGSSSLTYGPINLAGGSNFVSGNLPVSNIAPGSSAQVLMSNGTPVTTWTSFTGDVTVNSTGGTTVNSISGSSPITITPSTLQWVTGTSTPTINQANNTTNSATGQTLTIQAQNATGTTATGGSLTLTSGTGTTTAGNVNVQAGGTTIASATPNKWITNKGRRKNVTTITGTYTILVTDEFVIVTTLSSSFTITMPASPTIGDFYVIKDGTGNAGSKNLTIAGNGNTIDGSGNFTLNSSYGSIALVYNGTEWSIN